MLSQIRRFKLSACAAAFAILAGCSSQSTEEQMADARAALMRKDLAAALISTKAALQQNPDSAEARLLLGEVMVRADDGTAALVELEKARKLNPSLDRLLALEVEALLLTGNSAAAIAKIGDIPEGKPEAAAALHILAARAAAMQDRMPEADAHLAQARKLMPDYVPAILFEARRLADRGDSLAAGKLVDQVLAQDAKLEEALLLKGELARHNKSANFEAANDAYERVLALRANSVPAHAGLIEAAFSRNDLAAAKVRYEAMRKVLPNHPLTQFFGAEIALNEGNIRVARERVQPLLKNAGEDFKVLTLAGAIETQGRAYPLGETYLRRSLLLSPGNPFATRLLAQNLLGSGQPAKALAVLEPLLAKSKADAQSLALAGEASLAQRDIPASLKYFARVVELDPTHSRARAALALGQLNAGQPNEAIAALSAISKAETDDFSDLVLIAVHMNRRDYGAAARAVEALERKRPGSAQVSQIQGQIHLAQGNLAAARASFAKAIERDGAYFGAVSALTHIELEAGNAEAARNLLKTYLKPEVDNLFARAWLIELQARTAPPRAELDAAITDLVRRHPDAVMPRVLHVNHLLAYGEVKPALTAAQQGIAVTPDHPDMLDALGRAQAAAGDVGQAINTFKRLISAHPNLPGAHVHFADIQLAAGNVDGAINSLRRASTLAPQMATAQRGLIQLLVKRGQYAEALMAAKRMQAEPSARLSGYLLAADIDASRKRWDGAIATYRAGLAVEPASELAVGLRKALLASGNAKEAQSFAADWQAKHPKDNIFAFAQGEWAIAEGNWTEAETHLRRALDSQPESAATLNNLAFALMKQGKPEAIGIAERANAKSPNNAQLMDTLALTYSSQGKHAQAKETQRKAIALAPNDPMLKLSLVRILGAAGEKAEARRELEALSLKRDARLAKVDLAALMATLRD